MTNAPIQTTRDVNNNLPGSEQESPHRSLPPTTTGEQDLRTAGQRRVNLVWEGTQAAMAIGVTGAVIFNSIHGIESELLGNAFVMIIALYFVRTNHTKIGGVGGTDDRHTR